jgi:hypothetical protein
MPDTTSSFPETRRDVGNLKNTAVEAAKDLASTATTHANKAKGQVQDLASMRKAKPATRSANCAAKPTTSSKPPAITFWPGR